MAVAVIILLLLIIALCLGGGPIIRGILVALILVTLLILGVSTNPGGFTTLAYIWASLFILFLIGGGIAVMMLTGSPTVRRRAVKKQLSDAAKYPQHERERMLGEAEEIEPSIFRHPTGIFIVRGPKGGTKVYPTINLARARLDR